MRPFGSKRYGGLIMPSPRVSVCVPTYNGLGDLQRLLPALYAQEVTGGLEIRVLDSESTDGSYEYLSEQPVELDRIPQRDFGHGSARNRLAQGAQGEYLVFLSQDALPVGTDFLELLVEPLGDGQVAGAWARNLPHPDDDALTKRSLLDSVESSGEGRRVRLPEGKCLADLAANERVELTRFNNVASAMSRGIQGRFPFPEVSFGEDSAWAARVLGEGLELQYVAQAAVWHAHRYGPASAFDRYQQDARFLREVHGLVVRPGLLSVLKGWVYEVREDWKYLAGGEGKVWDWVRSPGLRLGQVLGQWRGSRPESRP